MGKMMAAKKKVRVLSCLVAKFMLVGADKANSADYMSVHASGVVA